MAEAKGNQQEPGWIREAQFYHIYPLGFCGAPAENPGGGDPVNRLALVAGHADYMRDLGVNALYLGPLFEAAAHGYDTADFYRVDRRLGSGEDMARMVWLLKEKGIRVVLDGVFHHVGRRHFAFRDLREKGEASEYRDWFAGVDFGGESPYGDGFSYCGWNGCLDLVKLNLDHPGVREHLFGAVRMWIRDWGIDGLRLDAADSLDGEFMDALAAVCRREKADFWLMGEVIHGDYNQWMSPGRLDSVTNYECYKGLWSSLNDGNMHEIAWSLGRQFGPGGVYAGRRLYSFADNHDVDRVASTLRDRRYLYPLHILLYTMPGIPSLYYGSEAGVPGKKLTGQGYGDDAPVRPSWEEVEAAWAEPELPGVIRRLSALRRELTPLREGGYRQVMVDARQLVFERDWQGQLVTAAVNGDPEAQRVTADLPAGHWEDRLNPGFSLESGGGPVGLELDGCWGRVLVHRG